MKQAFVAAAALAVSVSAQSVQTRPIAIAHVTVVDAASATTNMDVTVVVRDGRIASVGPGVQPPAGAEVIDARNQFLIPGLWDMHVHLSYARASALPAFVANGVTAVRDMGSDLREIDRWSAEVANGALVGPAIVRAGPILNGEEFNRYQLKIADAVEARTAVRTLHKVGVDLIKTHRRTSRDAYFALADEARKLKLPFAGHVPMTVSPAEASDAGQSTIEHAETLFEGTFAAEHRGEDLAAAIARWRQTGAKALFDAFVRNGTRVDPTLVAQAYVVRQLESGQPDPHVRYIAASARREADAMTTEIRRDPAKLIRERGPVLKELEAVTAMMHRAGVLLVTGTDVSVIHPPGFTLHDELALLVSAGLTPAEALRAATIDCAALFPALDAGAVAAGKRADLVLLDANPLDDIRNTQRIRGVVVRGRYLSRSALDRLLDDAARLAGGM